MESNRIKYEFSAKVYQYSTSPEMSGWTQNKILTCFHSKRQSEKKKILYLMKM